MAAPDSRFRPWHSSLPRVAVAAALLGSAVVPVLTPAAAAASTAAPVVCTSKSHPAFAAGLARDIQAARSGRSSTRPAS